MFDKKHYIAKLKEICERVPMGKLELAAHLEVSYPTLCRILDPDHPMKLRPSTIRKIKELVEYYEEEYGTRN